ncbi:EntF, Non-ribosomal peptide synthetase [Teratosphaeria destructans]|uniref:EntF, Non-ribosomal peptide synthetase n=1 Tax=Teratosphaeria destructans TaxID=418781 RepID=A0A9W7T017_9PEZI|nr:EntF, Non-ribosomal peptide synthetase [Teratosphaeria destructans]
MPRQVAPPPSGEFSVKLQKPFSGTPTHSIEVIGEPNRAASIKMHTNNTHKTGDVPKDDVEELLSLVDQLKGFPSHPSKDVYGLDTKVDFNTFDIQWSNEDEDPTAGDVSELAAEEKDDFRRIVESIEALGRTFAKKDAAI